MNSNSITNYRKLVFIGALLALISLPAAAIHISETFVLNWNATIYSTNEFGRIITTKFTAQDVIQKILDVAGNTDSPSLYALVYRPDQRDTVVIKRTDPNNSFTPAHYVSFQFFFTDFQNLFETWTIKQAFINDGDHSGVIGSIVGFEHSEPNDLGYRGTYSFNGHFQLAIPEVDGKWPQGVYIGTFSTGSKIWAHD